MSIVSTLECAGQWLRENVCKGQRFKPRSPDDRSKMSDWDYDLVEPAVWILYVPTHKDKPPDVKATSPGIAIELRSATDVIPQGISEYELRLCFATWDPGLHGEDMLVPVPETVGWVSVTGTVGRYERGGHGGLELTHEGWRDTFNFIDHARRAIENEGGLGPLLLLKPGTYPKVSLYEYEGGPADFYPFWQGYIELTVTARNVRYREDVEKHL